MANLKPGPEMDKAIVDIVGLRHLSYAGTSSSEGVYSVSRIGTYVGLVFDFPSTNLGEATRLLRYLWGVRNSTLRIRYEEVNPLATIEELENVQDGAVKQLIVLMESAEAICNIILIMDWRL